MRTMTPDDYQTFSGVCCDIEPGQIGEIHLRAWGDANIVVDDNGIQICAVDDDSGEPIIWQVASGLPRQLLGELAEQIEAAGGDALNWEAWHQII